MKIAGSVFLFLAIALMVSATVHAEGEAVTISLEKDSVVLYPPLEITSATMYRDGGTLSILIKDSKGASLPVCFDGRIKMPQEDRFLYVKAPHPSVAGAVMITAGSETEKTILQVIKSAKIVTNNPQDADVVKMMIEKLENR